MPQNPGLLLIRATKGHGSKVQVDVSKSCRKDFPPPTWMVHLTDHVHEIGEAGRLLSGAELGLDKGKSALHFMMVSTQDMEEGQDIVNRRGEFEGIQFLRSNL